MLLGLLSDSHGRRRTTAAAVGALLERGAGLLIHLGDFETDAVVDELVGQPALGVLGNCDRPRLLHYARSVDIELEPVSLSLSLDGKRIVATHGHVAAAVHAALREGADYLFHGHTHELRDEIAGRTRIINPGALAHADRYTVALLDMNTGHLDVIELPSDLD